MRIEKIREAAEEAGRFLLRVAELENARQKLERSWYGTPKESGAVRRASMDLTRALSEARKP